MGIFKKRKNVLIICISILLVIVLTVSYYGVFIYPEKQFEKQLGMLNTLEREIGLVLPNSSVFHSNSSMKYYTDANEDYTDAHQRAYLRFNIVASFNKKEYDKFISDLKVWEVGGGELAESQEQIMEKSPSYYRD